MKNILWTLEDLYWNFKCRYNLYLHGPYGLAKVVENIPFRFLVKYLRKYGATIGERCRFERGINIHRPFGDKPFQNLHIGSEVYLGHDTLIDLTQKVTIKDKVIIASRCQLWTHASSYNKKSITNPEYGEYSGELTIDECAIIYSNVVITHGLHIGKFARIGAGSLVNINVDESSFVSGVPIRIIKKT
ncbi:2,3,4,5-tetrahydropyridine-2,6-dicarboxylate N-acetyltransferase [anaerobic digester metagenome]